MELASNRRSRLWRIAAWIFALVNIGGAIYAGARGEQIHAELHLGLLLITFAGYLLWRGAPPNRQADLPPAELPDPRVEQLQQSVDAVALELERLGEKQRFNEKLMAERTEPRPSDP